MKDTKEIILSKFLELRSESPELALRLLMDNYGDVFNGLIVKMLDDEEAAEDVLQEGFIKVWKNINEYSPEKSSLFTWLHTILRNSAIDFLRRQNKRKIQKIDSGVYDNINFSQQTNIEDSGLIKQIQSLDTKYKEIIEQVYFKGFTQQEIAEANNIPLGTVKTRVNTALKLLRKIVIIIILIYLGIH